jgi:lipopolysaccharide export system protein LptA
MYKPLFLCCALVLTLLPAARAERADRLKPMQIEADSLQRDEVRQRTVISGRVTATKGTMVMRGERMEVTDTPDGRQNAVLTAAAGQLVFFRQKREGLDEFIEGQAERADYDSGRDVLTLTGRALLRTLRGNQSANQVEGQVIVFDNTSETYTVDGQSGNNPSRVRATIVPRSSPPTAAPPAAPALRSSPRLSP